MVCSGPTLPAAMHHKLCVLIPSLFLLGLALLWTGSHVQAAEPVEARLGSGALSELVDPELLDELAPKSEMTGPASCVQQDYDCISMCDFDHCTCVARCTWWVFNGVCLASCDTQRTNCYSVCY